MCECMNVVIMSVIDQGAMEDLEDLRSAGEEISTYDMIGEETSRCDTTDASLLTVEDEPQNLVQPLKFYYEGHFYEKYMASKFIGRLPANNDQDAIPARRTSWFENRRFLFDTKTQMAIEDEGLSDVWESDEDVGVKGEVAIQKIGINETLETSGYVEGEEASKGHGYEETIVSLDKQTIHGNENNNIVELHETNELNEQLNEYVYQNELEIMVESKKIEQSSSIQMTKDNLTPTENLAMSVSKEESLEKEDEVNEKAKRLLGMSDDYETRNDNNGNRHSSNGAHNESHKRGANVFSGGINNVKQKITRQLSRSFSFRKKSTTKSKMADNDDDITWIQAPKNAEEYPMRHRRRGVALIFNHNEFQRLAPRHSTERECRDLAAELTTLGFEVQVHHDLELAQLKSVLLKTSEMDHSDADCFLVAVLTIRQHGSLFSKDLPYDENMLMKRFTGDKCSTLAGKPKILIIDACREVRAVTMSRAMNNDATDSTAVAHMVPIEADILTVTWYYPWRDPTQGSWFVRALCDELRANAETRDLLTLLTFVNRRVALLCAPAEGDSEPRKDEMPTFTSMLTRQVYFRRKNTRKELGGV